MTTLPQTLPYNYFTTGLDADGNLVGSRVDYSQLTFNGILFATTTSTSEITLAYNTIDLTLDDPTGFALNYTVQIISGIDYTQYAYGIITALDTDFNVATIALTVVNGNITANLWSIQVVAGPSFGQPASASFGMSTDSFAVPAVGDTVSITTQDGKAFAASQSVLVTATTDATAYFVATINTYNSSTGALSLFVRQIGGSGTFATWNVALVDLAGADADLIATSTTSQTIGTGNFTFTIQSLKFLPTSSGVLVTSLESPANKMYGIVKAYSSTSMTILVNAGGTIGSGSFSSWSIYNVSGPTSVTNNFQSGLAVSFTTTDANFTVASGSAMDDTNTVMMYAPSSITKSITSLWTVGTGNGAIAPLQGTVSVTSAFGIHTLTGVGTAFSSDIKTVPANDHIIIDGSGTTYRSVYAIGSDTLANIHFGSNTSTKQYGLIGNDTITFNADNINLYAIRKDSDGSVDYWVARSNSSATLPSGYTYKRNLGKLLTSATSVVGFQPTAGSNKIWATATITTIGAATGGLTSTSSNVITWSTSDQFGDGYLVIFNGAGTYPTGITKNAIYYVGNSTADTTKFTLHTNPTDAAAGTNAITLTGNGSGTRSARIASITTAGNGTGNYNIYLTTGQTAVQLNTTFDAAYTPTYMAMPGYISNLIDDATTNIRSPYNPTATSTAYSWQMGDNTTSAALNVAHLLANDSEVQTFNIFFVSTADAVLQNNGPLGGTFPNETAGTLIGRRSTSVGAAEEITLGAGLAMSGSTLTATSGTGTVTTTGSPASGELAKFSGSTSITNGNLSGDVTTTDTLVTTLAAGNAGNLNSGTLLAARMPALTGDVTTSAGSVATTLASGSASNLNSGTLPAGRLPALTGDITTSAGSAATTLAAGSASNLNSGTLLAARMPAHTGDVTSSAGSVALTLAAGSASVLNSGTLPAARLPNPTSSALGGVQSYAAVSSQWINTISTSGVPSSTQPAESDLSFTDITTNNSSTSKHGFVPKLPNDAAKYYDGTGNYSVPAGAGGGTVTSVATAGLATGGPITTTGTVTVTAATQADMETATSTTTAVVPGRLVNGPMIPKAVYAATITPTAVTGSVSSVDATTDIVTWSTTHGLTTGWQIRGIGTVPAGWTVGQAFYVNALSTTTFALYTTLANALADTSRVNITATTTGATMVAYLHSNVSPNYGMSTVSPVALVTGTTTLKLLANISPSLSSAAAWATMQPENVYGTGAAGVVSTWGAFPPDAGGITTSTLSFTPKGADTIGTLANQATTAFTVQFIMYGDL